MPTTLSPEVDVPIAGRLFDLYRPRHYELCLDIDPDKDGFSGRVAVALDVARPTDRIVLHAAGIAVSEARVNGKSLEASRVRLNPGEETLILEPGAGLPAGPARVELAYSAPFDLQMRGLYIAKARRGGKEERHAYTKFEPTDARRMLPCVDEPEAKATFDVTVTAPDGWTVLGNTPVLRREAGRGRQTVSFKTSPKMSTYLLALGVGRLASRATRAGKTKVSVWALPHQLDQAGFALEAAKFSLSWLNRYFAIEYPLEKLDLAALPEFSSGAMENWGLITFRDSAMLADPKLSSGRAYRRVAEVVAHEVVHQWFGNLVTMRWWNDLWLNEAFATWLAFKVMDAWKPRWRVWRSYEERKSSALPIDALENTRAISSEVRSIGDIEAQFDHLTYEKGGAVLRMIESHLGEKAFRDGVRLYMRRHRFGNTEARDLWKAIEEASGEPITRLAAGWLTRPGFPLISVGKASEDGRTLRLSQRRFSAYGPSRDETLWSAPIALKYKLAGEKKARTRRLLLEGRDETAVLAGRGKLEWTYPNAGETGFYRVALEAGLLKPLGRCVRTALDSAERSSFLSHAWALARNGSLPLGDFLEVLRGFAGETDWTALDVARSCLAALHDRVAGSDEERLAVRKLGLDLAGPAARKLGWGPRRGDDERLLRACALGILADLSPDDAFVKKASASLARYLKNPACVDSALAAVSLDLGARSDPGRLDEYVRLLDSARTPEQKDHALKAFAEFRDPVAARRALELSLTERVLGQDIWKPLGFALRNPAVQRQAWDFVREHWAAIRRKAGERGASRLIEFLAGFWSLEAAREAGAFFNEPAHRVPCADRTLKQTLELMELGAAFRERARKELKNWAGF